MYLVRSSYYYKIYFNVRSYILITRWLHSSSILYLHTLFDNCNQPLHCRYILSGSDYGERKLLLWDAAMPVVDKTHQFPHIVTWTREGLIRRLVMRRMTPHPSFWLTVDQVARLDEQQEVDVWPGEAIHMEVTDSDSDSDAEANDIMKEDEDIAFRRHDVLEAGGVILSVVSTDRSGENDEAKEYRPGGRLAIILQVRLQGCTGQDSMLIHLIDL